MKVSLYVRQRGTREQKKHNPKKSYPLDGSIIWVLRYGKAWETLDVRRSPKRPCCVCVVRSNSMAAGVRPPR